MADNTQNVIGPIQILVIGFKPDFKFTGTILEEFQKLEENKTIRVLDLLFVKKDEDNSGLIALDWQGEELGGIVGTLLGFDFDEYEAQTTEKNFLENNSLGITREDIEKLGESLEPGAAAGFLLIEHVWARGLKAKIRDAGGIPIAEGFLTPETIKMISPEIAAITKDLNESS